MIPPRARQACLDRAAAARAPTGRAARGRAEGAGFEPAVRGRRTLVFKTSAFDRSATPPYDAIVAGGLRGKLYTASDPGEVAEWLKALAC